MMLCVCANWCLVAAGGPGRESGSHKLGMMLCVSMCACFQLGGGEGERRERGAEEGGRCWAFRVSLLMVLSELGCRLPLERLIKSG